MTELTFSSKAELLSHYAAVSARLNAGPPKRFALGAPVVRALVRRPAVRPAPAAREPDVAPVPAEPVVPLEMFGPPTAIFTDYMASKRILVADVVKHTVLHFEACLGSILQGSRLKEHVHPRQIAMYLAKEITGASFPEIGIRMGGRDHTTVIHAYRKIASLIETDERVASDVAAIRASILERHS